MDKFVVKVSKHARAEEEEDDKEEERCTKRPRPTTTALYCEAIVSMSRRCDVMTTWSSKYMPAIADGAIEWVNPFNCNQRKMVSLRPHPGALC